MTDLPRLSGCLNLSSLAPQPVLMPDHPQHHPIPTRPLVLAGPDDVLPEILVVVQPCLPLEVVHPLLDPGNAHQSQADRVRGCGVLGRFPPREFWG